MAKAKTRGEIDPTRPVAEWIDRADIVIDRNLKGSPRAILAGNDLYVSPALASLLGSESGESLLLLLGSIKVVDAKARI